jgi:Domain of unknown function (DUF4145)
MKWDPSRGNDSITKPPGRWCRTAPPNRARGMRDSAPMAPDRDPDTLPTRKDPNGPCPRCGRVSNFSAELEHPLWLPVPMITRVVPGSERAVVLRCQGCRLGTVVIERARDHPNDTWDGVYWWPTPGAGHLDPAVPEGIAEPYDEGMRCLAVKANHAAVVMFRSALYGIVDDQGSEAAKQKRRLGAQLKQMAADHTLHPSLVPWAERIKDLGDIGAHALERGVVVAPKQAADLGRLTRQMIRILYEVPASIRADAGEPDETELEASHSEVGENRSQ